MQNKRFRIIFGALLLLQVMLTMAMGDNDQNKQGENTMFKDTMSK